MDRLHWARVLTDRSTGKGKGKGDTAARILEAADALLGERGYDGVSMRDIARRAGVNKALVFYHWKSKEDLFDAVLDRYYEAHAAALEGAFAAEGTFRERIHRLIDAYADFMDAHAAYPRLVQLEILRGGTHLKKIQKNLGTLFTWTVKTLQGVAPEEGPTSARQLFLSIAGLVVHYYTYAPALKAVWGEDPLGKPARAERRRHLHWVVDALVDKLVADSAHGLQR